MTISHGVMISELGKQTTVSLIFTGCPIFLALCQTKLSFEFELTLLILLFGLSSVRLTTHLQNFVTSKYYHT